MSYFQTQDQTFEAPDPYGAPHSPEPDADHDEGAPPRSPAARLSELRERIARAVSGPERGQLDPLELDGGPPAPDGWAVGDPAAELPARFPVGPLGYSRAAVDEYIADLERENARLRRELPGGMTITEEIERIGEQTASILVVAHDQAKDTRRRAQEQADRCVADAAASAVAMTEKADRRLREIDNETDAVWQERARLLEDARVTGQALVALAHEAAERFPEEAKTGETQRI